MSGNLTVLYLFLAMLVAMPGRAEERTVAAWVNEKPITEAQVGEKMRPVLEMLHKKLGQPPDGTIRLKVREKALQSLIDREVALTSDRAKSIRIASGAVEETMVIEQIKQALAATLPPCTDAEAKALYHEKPSRFESGGRVKISLIKLDFDEIETVHNPRRFVTGVANQLFEASNEAWENAAADYSSGPNADNGGHWDWTAPDLLPDGLGKTVAHMDVGGFEKVSTKDYDYLLRLDAVEERVQLSFEQARGRVKEEVMRRKVESAWQDWIRAEKKKASIKIKNADLW